MKIIKLSTKSEVPVLLVLCLVSAKIGQTAIAYGACPKIETCAFSGRLTHHCTVAGGVGYEKILDWPPWKEPLPRRSWLTTA